MIAGDRWPRLGCAVIRVKNNFNLTHILSLLQLRLSPESQSWNAKHWCPASQSWLYWIWLGCNYICYQEDQRTSAGGMWAVTEPQDVLRAEHSGAVRGLLGQLQLQPVRAAGAGECVRYDGEWESHSPALSCYGCLCRAPELLPEHAAPGGGRRPSDIRDDRHTDILRPRLHLRPRGKLSRYLRRVEVLQDAHGDQHVHPSPRRGRRVLPCGDSFPHCHHVHERVALRGQLLQGVLHHHLHQPDHQLPLLDGPLSGPLRGSVSPDLLPEVQDGPHSQDRVAVGVAGVGPPHAARLPVRHHHLQAWRRPELQHLLEEHQRHLRGGHPQRADGLHILHSGLWFPRTTRIHSNLLCSRNGTTNVLDR